MTITLTREEAQQVLECMETAIKAGDWVVDGACDPDFILYMLRTRLAQPEPEPEHPDAIGSPCPEFWDWLPKAYGQSESFTKYNMEVAFLAGAQLSARQQPVAYMGTDIEGNPNKFRLNAFGGSIPLYTAPPQREWQGLTKDEINDWDLPDSPTVYEFAQFVEAKLKEKNR